jgi:hypothetical protein
LLLSLLARGLQRLGRLMALAAVLLRVTGVACCAPAHACAAVS